MTPPLRRQRLPPLRHRRARAAAQGDPLQDRGVPAADAHGGDEAAVRPAHRARAEARRREDQRVARDPAPPRRAAARARAATRPTRRERASVEEAEAWGDDVLQALVRRVLWPTFKAHPEAMATFARRSKLPAIPVPVLKLIAPVATRIEMKANEATDATYPADVRSLPDVLDQIDGWIADGVLGGEQPNAADLQIATSVRLLMALGRPAADDRAAARRPARAAAVPGLPRRRRRRARSRRSTCRRARRRLSGAQPPAAASARRRRGARPRRAAAARARRCRRAPSGVRRSKSSSSSGIRTNRRDVDLLVREREPLARVRGVAEQQHVDVDRARALEDVARLAGERAAELALHRLARVEQRLRRERRSRSARRR